MPGKILKVIIVTFFFINGTYSQAPSIEWQKCYGGISDESSFGIGKTSDGGSIVCGSTNAMMAGGDVGSPHGAEDCWVIKLDAAGTIMWEKCLGGNAADRAFSIEQTSDGGYILAGDTRSDNSGDVGSNHGLADYWIVKLTNTGAISWQKTYGGTGTDLAYSIHQTTDAGYIVSGESNSLNGDITAGHGGYDYWILKLGNTGNLIWQKSFGGSNHDYGRTSVQTFDGGYIVGGSATSNDGDVDPANTGKSGT